MDLLDFAPELVNLIISFLDYNERLQLNRVSKSFNIELSPEQFVEYVDMKLKTDNFKNRLLDQLNNPLWIQKYGMFPLPTFNVNITNKNILLDAFRNSDFVTLRAIFVMHGFTSISLTITRTEFDFVDELGNRIGRTFDSVTIDAPWVYAHLFGCNDETYMNLYNLSNQLVKEFPLYADHYSINKAAFTIGHNNMEFLHGDKKQYIEDIYSRFSKQKYLKWKNRYKNLINNLDD